MPESEFNRYRMPKTPSHSEESADSAHASRAIEWSQKENEWSKISMWSKTSMLRKNRVVKKLDVVKNLDVPKKIECQKLRCSKMAFS